MKCPKDFILCFREGSVIAVIEVAMLFKENEPVISTSEFGSAVLNATSESGDGILFSGIGNL